MTTESEYSHFLIDYHRVRQLSQLSVHSKLIEKVVYFSYTHTRNIDEVEFATLEWVDWFNNRRLLEPIGNIPPAEFEMAYYRQLKESADAA